MEPSPSIFPPVARIVVIGDIHGDLERLVALLKAAGVVDDQFRWVAQPPDTVVVQMGDQIDSRVRDGSDLGWEQTADVQVLFFMDQLDRNARAHGGRVVSLLGNHELMNVMGNLEYVSPHSMALLGGPGLRAATFAPGGILCHKYLAARPVVVQIGPFLFCHAGLLLDHLKRIGGRPREAIEAINALMRRTLLGQPFASPGERALFDDLFVAPEGILWTRALSSPEGQQRVLPVLTVLGARALFVGHTVQPDGITTTADHAVWFVDTGISRVFANGKGQALDIRDSERISVIRI